MIKFTGFLRIFMALMALLLPSAVLADSNAPAKLIKLALAKKLKMPEAKKLLVPVADLYRVDEGVFELEIGKTIDLTDRKILLSIKKSGRRCCILHLNGSSSHFRTGERTDLKTYRSTAPFVEDKDVCFLDNVDIAVPKGARGIATFRLHCP